MRRKAIQGPCGPAPSPEALGAFYERHLADTDRDADSSAPSKRRGTGAFYTPAGIVDFIVDQTLRPLAQALSSDRMRRLRILDPACGCGAFLLGAYRWLLRWHASTFASVPGPRQRRAIAQRQLAGIDLDPAAVDLARQAICTAAGLSPADLTTNLCCGDALLTHDDWFDQGFDVVLANPPYVNIRRLASSGARLADEYRQRYRCATGAFDLYVLFLERSLAALRSGGRLGVIVPNKLATLDYARQCREMLLGQGTLDAVVDVSNLRLFFRAMVYPYILLWTKGPVPATHTIRVVQPPVEWQPSASPSGQSAASLADCDVHRVLQSRQSAGGGWRLAGELDVESRVPTATLGSLCTIHSGATGFQAAALAARLVDIAAGKCASQHKLWDFIVSGNVDPYVIRPGDVRFMGRSLERPQLAADDPLLSERKRRLYSGKKIVLAGMARRLEAAYDTRGLALGVQVYALAEWQIDPHYLLGLLNSRLLTQLFRLRFAAKRLAGGYFTLSKRQLSELPIRVLDLQDRGEKRLHDELVELVQRRISVGASLARRATDIDRKIDALVSRIYRVGAEELVRLPEAA